MYMYHVLVVDDEVYTVKGLQAGVQWDKFDISSVHTAHSAKQARAVFEAHPVDLLICDIEMHQESGLDLLEWIRRYYPSTEAVFLTCHSEFSYAQRAIQLHALDYLLKPVKYEALEEVMKRALEKIKESKRLLQVLESHRSKALAISNGEVGGMPSVTVVEKAKQFIDEHIGQQDLSRVDIANSVFLHPDHLTRVFKKETGMSLSNYLQVKRLELAKELLTHSEMPISDIALTVGYSNLSYFSNIFKKHTDMNPINYRRNAQSHSPTG
ncbi:response regulator [Ammoniphilus sp. YIM 78166]|uniref:response regulator transcription factor n=1 Tax=Ammoniphilus sp. YIM 78166 TaxID=1644106 RepID=UPI001F0F8DE5|nr:response regulator [Ammoniphilus sp. YIM 78166]